METRFEVDGKIVEIERDENPENPRESQDNMGTMVCWHSRYRLGDKKASEEYPTPHDFGEGVDAKRAVILPLYLYDHSGITMSTSPFSCRWDSGQIGYIFVTYDRIRQEYGKVTQATKEKARKVLEAEVSVYDQYLTGDIWVVTIKKRKACNSCDHVEEETLDSLCGVYGFDWAEKEGREMALNAA